MHIQVNISILMIHFCCKSTIIDFFISDAGPGLGSNSSLLGMFALFLLILLSSVQKMFRAVWWSLRSCNLC